MTSKLKIKWSRAETGRWLVANAGLPSRIAQVAKRSGLKTLGALRRMETAEIETWPSVGPRSLQALDLFWERVRQLEAGGVCFASVREWLDAFLSPVAVDVLARRFGAYPLLTPDTKASQTLQEIGNELNLSRERVRQLEQHALRQLRQEVPRALLNPFLQRIEEQVRAAGGVLTGDDLARLPYDPYWAGWRVEGIWCLLLRVAPEPITRQRELFTTWSAEDRKTVDGLVAECCASVPETVALKQLHARVQAGGVSYPPVALVKWLDADSRLWALSGQRYLWRAHGVEALLDAVDVRAGGPLHYRGLTAHINAHLRPAQTISPGRVLRALNRHPQWVSTVPGHYRLKR